MDKLLRWISFEEGTTPWKCEKSSRSLKLIVVPIFLAFVIHKPAREGHEKTEEKKITQNQIYSFVLHCSSREFVRIFRHNSFESSVRNREKMDLTFEKFPDAIEMLARFPLFRASSSLSGCFARKNRTNNFGVARWIVSESCCFLPQRLWREKWSLAIKKRITVPKSRVSRSFGCIYPYTFDRGPYPSGSSCR